MRVVKRSSCISTGTASPSRAAEPLGELARLARLLAVGAAQRQRQPDDHALDLALGTSCAQRARARARAPGAPPRSIGVTIVPVGSLTRAAAAGAAVVEREHAHRLSSAPRAIAIAARAARRAPRPSFSGLAPARLGHRVAPAAAAADDLGGRLDDGARLDAALDERRARRSRRRCTRPSAAVPSSDRRVAEPALQPVGELEQRLRVGRPRRRAASTRRAGDLARAAASSSRSIAPRAAAAAGAALSSFSSSLALALARLTSLGAPARGACAARCATSPSTPVVLAQQLDRRRAR